MKIKLTTFYALRAIYRIYLTDEEVVTSTRIAGEDEISQGVLLRLLRCMDKEGVLTAHQGRGAICGGFSLAKDIDKITVLEVLDIFEGVDLCKNLEGEVRIKQEPMHNRFNQINDHIREELSKYTIRDLFESESPL